MSDLRRRRKQSGESDDLSDSYDELNVTKETQNSEQTDVHRDSEYDTAGSDSGGDSQDGGERESGDGQEEDKPQRKLDDDEDRRNPQYIPKRGTFYEHDDRTTEETSETTTEPPPERETKEKKVWKDKEDRWNHDRYNDDEQAPKSHEELIAVYGYDIRNEEGPPRARRRRRYGRGPNKYTRNWEDEDAYGKTAPSVTSSKNPGKRTNRSGEEFPALGGVEKDESNDSVDEPVITSAWYINKNKAPIKQQNFPPLQSQQDNNQKSKSGSSNTTHTNENRAPNEPTNPAWKKEAKGPTRNLSPNLVTNRNVFGLGGGVGETEKLTSVKPMTRDTKEIMKKRQVQESVSLAASRVRGRGFKAGPNNNLVGNRIVDLKPKGRGAGLTTIDTRRNNTTSHHDEEHQHLVNDTKHMSLNDGSYHPRQTKNFYVQSPGQPRPNVVPQRMQQQQQQQQQQHPPHHQQQQQQQQQLQAHDQTPQHVHSQQSDVTGNRPKRYSSLRQRPTIPEGPGQQQQQPQYPPQHPQHGFYPPQAGNSHGVVESQGFPQGHFEPPAPVGNSSSPMAGQPVIPLAPGGQPSAYAPPPFLVPPPQFITPQAAPPSIINYVPTPAGPAFPPNFQGYQGYNTTVQPQGPPPPPELFQPQGCTYYSPAQQQQQQGAPIRRPKAAIPILPPPDTCSPYNHHHQTTRGRGKSSQHGNYINPGNVPSSQSQQQQQQQQIYREQDIRPQEESTNEHSKIPPEVFENPRYGNASSSLEEKKNNKFVNLPSESVATEVVVESLTIDPVGTELELKNEPAIVTHEIHNIIDNSTEISSDTIVEQPEFGFTKKSTEPESLIVFDNETEMTIVLDNEKKLIDADHEEKKTIFLDNEEKSIVLNNEKKVVVLGNDEQSIVLNNEENSIVLDYEEKLIVLNNEENSIVLNNEENPIVLNNEVKSIVHENEEKSIVHENEENSIVLENEENSIVLENEENSIVLENEENLIVINNEEKSSILNNEENSIVLNNEGMSIVLNNEEKSIVLYNEKKSIVVNNEENSIVVNNEEKSIVVNNEEK